MGGHGDLSDGESWMYAVIRRYSGATQLFDELAGDAATLSR